MRRRSTCEQASDASPCFVARLFVKASKFAVNAPIVGAAGSRAVLVHTERVTGIAMTKRRPSRRIERVGIKDLSPNVEIATKFQRLIAIHLVNGNWVSLIVNEFQFWSRLQNGRRDARGSDREIFTRRIGVQPDRGIDRNIPGWNFADIADSKPPNQKIVPGIFGYPKRFDADIGAQF